MNGTYTKKQGFEIPEHVLWAPRKVRVACIGAGASGVMFCYKKEREFGEDMDLVVYESMVPYSSYKQEFGLTSIPPFWQGIPMLVVFGTKIGLFALIT